MCAQHTFCDRAGFEQAEAEQDGIADNAPDGADGIAGNRHVLYQHGIDGNTNQNQESLKSQREQAFQIVLSHVRLFMVSPCGHGNRRKAHHAVDLDYAPVHDNKNDD